MSLFKKNSNEKAYPMGRKNFTDVIKNSGVGDLLIWRQPEEDFNDNSTLVVMPGEAAVFIKGGIIEQVFENGTYKLSTDNYPFLSRLRNSLSGGVSVYNCVIYFIKTSISREIGWGTSSPIKVRDKILGIPTDLKANGAYKVRVSQFGKFIEKLVGNNITQMTPDDLDNYFFNEFQSAIRTVIAQAIDDSQKELLGIDMRLKEISDLVKPYLQQIFDGYGLACVNFSVAEIIIDDNELRSRYEKVNVDMYEQDRQGEMTAKNTVRQGTAEAEVAYQKGLAEARVLIEQGKAQGEVMQILGQRWGKQQAATILRDLANNQAAGGVANMGAGLGLGMASASVFGGMAQQMLDPINEPSPQPEIGVPSGRFKQQSDDAAADSGNDPVQTLQKLKQMLDLGLIDQAEYDAKKAEILKRL